MNTFGLRLGRVEVDGTRRVCAQGRVGEQDRGQEDYDSRQGRHERGRKDAKKPAVGQARDSSTKEKLGEMVKVTAPCFRIVAVVVDIPDMGHCMIR
jgi:hypothetical protein